MEKYIIGYFVIGFIYTFACMLKYWSEWCKLNGMEKLMAMNRGHGYLSNYVIIFLSRLIAWPLYIISGICN